MACPPGWHPGPLGGDEVGLARLELLGALCDRVFLSSANEREAHCKRHEDKNACDDCPYRNSLARSLRQSHRESLCHSPATATDESVEERRPEVPISGIGPGRLGAGERRRPEIACGSRASGACPRRSALDPRDTVRVDEEADRLRELISQSVGQAADPRRDNALLRYAFTHGEVPCLPAGQRSIDLEVRALWGTARTMRRRLDCVRRGLVDQGFRVAFEATRRSWGTDLRLRARRGQGRGDRGAGDREPRPSGPPTDHVPRHTTKRVN